MVNDRRETEYEGILVAIAEYPVVDDRIDECPRFCLWRNSVQVGMLCIEGCEPVAQRVEKAIALHLLEASEVNIGTLLLHVDHLLHRALQFICLLICSFGVQNVFHRVILNFFKSVLSHTEAAVAQNVRHDVALNGLIVPVGIDAADNLPLYFC